MRQLLALCLLASAALFATGCKDTPCSDGSLGCACSTDTPCKDDFVCATDSTCQIPGCHRGEAGCGCLAGNTCSTPTDGTHLSCTDGVCTVDGCKPGERGCACLPSGTCGPDLTCYAGRLCVRDYGGGPESLTPPANPKCYTPCNANLVDANNQVRTCSPEGLMEGCVGGRTCTNGTCVDVNGKAAVDPPHCSEPIDCPTHQTCIGYPDGVCYSNCETDTDCSGDRRCYRKVCRLPCDTSQSTCPPKTFCETTDGEHGFCMPLSPPGGEVQREVVGSFSMSSTNAEFTNNSISATFKIKNDSAIAQDFSIRKLSHTEYTNTGAVQVTTNAMSWVKLGSDGGTPMQVQELVVNVAAGAETEIKIDSTLNSTLSRWDGILEISTDKLGTRTFNLTYASRPDGRWAGKMFYFTNFRDTGLDAWLTNKADAALLANVQNAFVQKWAEFKGATIPYREWEAILNATQTGSWAFDAVKNRCPSADAPDPTRGCYLYDNSSGIALYSTSLDTYPIPSGLVELPITMNLRTTNAGTPSGIDGKILSSETLHYAGDPKVTLKFRSDPTGCTSNMNGTCVMMLDDFKADVVVGGRYNTTQADAACSKAAAGNFKLVSTPWLVPGFTEGTSLDTTTNLRYSWECRDQLFPFGSDASFYKKNASFAASNPVPDARSRRRTVELIDGAMINQSKMVVIFRERFSSFLGPTDGDFSAYGYIILSKEPVATLTPADFAGSTQSDTRLEPNLDTLACKPEVLSKVLAVNEQLTPSTAQKAVRGLIDGLVPSGAPPVALDPIASPEKVHYFCEDNGYFDGGPSTSTKIPCPIGSKVTFFTMTNVTDAQIAADACQTTKTCQQRLNDWVAAGTSSIRLNPSWQCKAAGAVYCDADRLDLRSPKTFYPATETKAVFVPVRQAIESAFRYKTRFRNRSGTNVGFTPQTCVPNSDAVPYCYDPDEIQLIRSRVDCAISIYSNPTLKAALDAPTVASVQGYLGENFSYTEEVVAGQPLPLIHDGFERLNAEILIMLGDEAYTRAFASRFDLSNSALVSFQGSLFEPNGINLSGAAGYEMYNLYLADQYYQLALDRFYTLGPRLLALINELKTLPQNPAQRIVSSYFTRLIRASTQKARTASEIAKRYQNFNRPDLARLVVERAYTASYLESVVLSRMMLRLISFSSPQDRAQIVRDAETSSLGYRSALLEMRDFYKDVTDKVNFFGFSPDYIPFPALEQTDSNAVAKLLASVQSKMSTAAAKEQTALTSNRSFDTDAAAFQNELAKVRNEYENQLAEICGTFTASDGQVYPAIPKYAPLHPTTARMGDPCGLVGNGSLHDAMAASEVAGLDFQLVVAAEKETEGKIANEQEHVTAMCNLQNKIALEDYNAANKAGSLKDELEQAQLAINATQRLLDRAGTLFQLYKCSIIAGTAAGGDCPASIAAAAGFTALTSALEVGTIATEALIQEKEGEITTIQNDQAYWKSLQDCEFAKIDSNRTVKDLLLEMTTHNLQALRADYNIRLAFAQIQKLRNQATRLVSEQSETEQLTINIEAARNDPNVRIYKNDDILTADRTFQDALREAYKATKVFEYYTSQSYAHLNDLFLVRMVQHGDISLESYVMGLQNEFASFEEQFGKPDLRVAVISLRDDVLKVPRLSPEGRALTSDERTALFRDDLKDVKRLDQNGYLTFPFATKVSDLSPLTRNHKVAYVETELVGTDVGDTVGRVYLRQKGTGVVSSLFGSDNFYALPERVAVLNPFFNGDRIFDTEVYRNGRMKDRPMVNTNWELVINQKDEAANKDINLQSLSDVRLFVYYNDFTKL